MAESVDASDLKSAEHYDSWEFKSPHSHRGSTIDLHVEAAPPLNILRIGTRMRYHLDIKYCWFKKTQLVLMYFINGIPYTFDDVEESLYFDPEIVEWANENTQYDLEDLFRWSNYLVMEECHPLMFDLELDNPELLPID